MTKVYVLEAPRATLAVAENGKQALRWKERLDDDPEAPHVTIYEMEVGSPPNFQTDRTGRGERGDG